jgi:hypothetical protein
MVRTCGTKVIISNEKIMRPMMLYAHLARRMQSKPPIVPSISTSEGLPNGVDTVFSVRPSRISGSSRPDPPIIPI